MADLTKTIKEAAYVVVGLGVLGVQQAQVRRRELAKQFEGQRKQFEAGMAAAVDQVSQLAKTFNDRIEPVVDDLEDRLPEPAKDFVKQAREAAKEAQGQFWSYLGRPTTTPGSKAA